MLETITCHYTLMYTLGDSSKREIEINDERSPVTHEALHRR